MKTTLPITISSIAEAQAFLKELRSNHEHFHPEDDAQNIDWACTPPSQEECEKLNDLMEAIYNLDGNDNYQDMAFDPCLYLMVLDKAEVAISIDGEPTTIGEYVEVNDWEIIKEHIADILALQDFDDEFPLPVHCGFVAIRLIPTPRYCIRRHINGVTLNDHEYVLTSDNNTSTFGSPDEAIQYLNSLTDVKHPTIEEWEAAGIYIVDYNSLTHANGN